VFLKKSVGVSRGAEGRARVRGVKMHCGKINNGGGKSPRRNAPTTVQVEVVWKEPCTSQKEMYIVVIDIFLKVHFSCIYFSVHSQNFYIHLPCRSHACAWNLHVKFFVAP
jgi:hypothetical protein